MPQQQINGPEGPINFPDSMSHQDIEQAMQRLYPPKQAKSQAPPSMLERVGSMVPEWSTPALAAAKKYAVDPFESIATKGAKAGSEMFEGAAARAIQPFAAPDLAAQGNVPMEEMERRFPHTLGIASGVGSVAGGVVADPRNWPFLASSAARLMLQRMISGGFSGLMAKGTYDAAKNLHDNWDSLTPKQRTEIATEGGLSALMAVGATHHAVAGGEIPARPTQVEEVRAKTGESAQSTPAVQATIPKTEETPPPPIKQQEPSPTPRTPKSPTQAGEIAAPEQANYLKRTLAVTPQGETFVDRKSYQAPDFQTADGRLAKDVRLEQSQYALGLARKLGDPGKIKSAELDTLTSARTWSQYTSEEDVRSTLQSYATNQRARDIQVARGTKLIGEFMQGKASFFDTQTGRKVSKAEFKDISGVVLPTVPKDFAASLPEEMRNTLPSQPKLYKEAIGRFWAVKVLKERLGAIQEENIWNSRMAQAVAQGKGLDLNEIRANKGLPKNANAPVPPPVSPGAEMGGTAKTKSSPIPDKESIQVSKAAEGSREPIPGASRSKVDYIGPERRAIERKAPLQGAELVKAIEARKPIQTPFDVTEGAQATIDRDLRTRGIRPPGDTAPVLREGVRDLVSSMGSDTLEARTKEILKKKPNMAEGTARRLAQEQLDKERGSLSFKGGDDDPSLRRDAKIKGWIEMLRDQRTTPEIQDRVFKNLMSYGLSHDEIIRRVSGAEGFAETGASQESLEERTAGYPLPGERESTLGHIPARPGASGMDLARGEGTVAPSDREASRIGQPDVRGIKSPDIEELDRIASLKDPRRFEREDERGSLSFRRRELREDLEKLKPREPERPLTSIQALTTQLESSLKAEPPGDTRWRAAERLATSVAKMQDAATQSIYKLAAGASVVKDAYLRPPAWTDFKDALGRFSGTLNRNAFELREFTKAIKEKVPDPARREAMTNWIQAGGDDNLLAMRANKSKGPLRAAYDLARTLTPGEKDQARLVQDYFKNQLDEAQRLGILNHGVDNYVRQVWKRPNPFTNELQARVRTALLQRNPAFAKQRIFDSYFEGEQAGHVPMNKDIGFLVSAYDSAFRKAVASRAFVNAMRDGKASDGQPLIEVSGVGKPVTANAAGEGDPEAYFIYPKNDGRNAPIAADGKPYRTIDNPAMTAWKWVTKDPNGAPVYLQGDLKVHPEVFPKLRKILGWQNFAEEHPIMQGALKTSAFFKQVLLAAAPFHQVQEGTHALFHAISPFAPKAIDLADNDTITLLNHGLVIGNYDSQAAFEEGLFSGGPINKVLNVPGLLSKKLELGTYLQRYTDYLFQDYIPRLKTAMAKEAYNRNIVRFQGKLRDGTLTMDQLAELTAHQANAAFGELNYLTLARSPMTQAMLRFAFLAPDFLEARARFVGQALKPFGREQYTALFLRGGLGMYTAARVVNKVLDDDYHWDKPFSLVHGGYEYKLRTLPGDIYHLMEDRYSFLYSRFNPLTVRTGQEFAFGKDEFGRHKDFSGQMMDFVRNITPIFAQGWVKNFDEETAVGTLEKSVGITRSKYRSEGAALAHKYSLEDIPNITSHNINRTAQAMRGGEYKPEQGQKLIQSGQMNPRDMVTAMQLAREPELVQDFQHLPNEQKAKVWELLTPKERGMIVAYQKKAHSPVDPMRLLPSQRQDFVQHMQEENR